MPRDARTMMSAFENKGFTRRDGKDVYFHLYVGGKKTRIYTKISHGEKEVHDGLLGTMARQLGLTKKQMGELVDCPLSQEAYVKILQDGGHIAKN
ncbi:MAG: hypothetical protein IT443_12335 [Phycisphaeraceae bacterium]|nr:hypothetical protein [Phycisphaeraceae bacterium]